MEFVAEVTRLLFASCASTVVLNAVPAVAVVGGDLNTNLVAAPGFTVIAVVAELTPVPEAVRVTELAVLRVTVKVPLPEASEVEPAGLRAAGSVDDSVGVMEWEVALLPNASL